MFAFVKKFNDMQYKLFGISYFFTKLPKFISLRKINVTNDFPIINFYSKISLLDVVLGRRFPIFKCTEVLKNAT